LLDAVRSGCFPIRAQYTEGSLPAALVAAAGKSALVVCATDRDAAGFAADTVALGCPTELLPAWGVIPYRPLPPGSSIFGERARVLCNLALGKAGLLVTSERAFLTPVPPPDYLRGLVVTLRKGDKLDTARAAERFALYGWNRVPRVQMAGEFALRGEVLDLFPVGEPLAYRVLFDFETIASIKQFDPYNQAGKDLVDEVAVYPLKEVIWTDDRIDALAKKLAGLDEFPDHGDAVIGSLISRKAMEGEEYFFPLAFDRRYSLIDYQK
jgi:transcription-repair coupling factor (superfamily II helicase)